MKMTMTHGSLFSGIGGVDLAAAWAGWENVFACEIDPFCQKVLKYHFPNSTLYENIRTTDFTIWRGRIDVLSGGFPCQPFSTAGKRKGTEDDRYLWPEMLRAIREISPRWVVGENVLGIVNWNGGMVFEQVCADMEAEGYEVQPYVLPACGVGAPHQRNRVWFVAKNTECIRCYGELSENPVPGNSGSLAQEIMSEYVKKIRLLPTPAAQNCKGANSIEALTARGRLKTKADNLADQFAVSGRSSQLNPLFVAEMMGFPVNWTVLPFLPGAEKVSKPTEMR